LATFDGFDLEAVKRIAGMLLVGQRGALLLNQNNQ
jgi:hypothetical protein